MNKVNVGTIGHIDHGSLGLGQALAILLGDLAKDVVIIDELSDMDNIEDLTNQIHHDEIRRSAIMRDVILTCPDDMPDICSPMESFRKRGKGERKRNKADRWR